MAYPLGEASQEALSQAHPYIVRVCKKVIKEVNVAYRDSFRGKEQQNKYYREGKSKVKWPESYHNKTDEDGEPRAQAIHILPYPEYWRASTKRWYYVAGMAVGAAIDELPEGWEWRWGGDWDGDDIFTDNNFDDLAHHEIRQID